MEELLVFCFLFLFFVLLLFLARSAYLKGIAIQEEGKTMRSRANAAERTNQEKMNGLFEMRIAEIVSKAGGGEGSELLELIKLLPIKKNDNGGSSDPSAPPSQEVSWDVMKEQLKNPQVKKVILENRDEALRILQS